ncbi:MAG TPA: diguanylate cyclase [Solirubrobacteraceae bacterium]|nr:diguanylate cyclase [Solirubrobacteraceae bacterium]
MAIVISFARGARALPSLISWGAMPRAVRVLLAVLVTVTLLLALRNGTSWLTIPKTPFEYLYNGVLVGSAVLCLIRAAVRRSERMAWTMMGVALALYAAGNIYWQLALADVATAPYPSLADACWLGVPPSFYLGVVLLVRERMPHLDSRLWLDGIVAALATAAVSAALVFGALQVSTGGDPAAVATNLAYPLGDMILLASVIGAMAAGRSRLDRSWLWFGAGIAAFAVTDSVYLLQIAKETYVGDALLDIGWLVAGLLVGIAAWQPSVRKRSTGDELPSIIAPTVLALASLALLVYDHFHPINLLAVALSSAALVAVLIRLSLTHRESRTNLVTTRVQARTDSLTGLGNRFALQRALTHALGDPAPHVLLLFDLDGFKNYNDSYGHPAGDALLTRLGLALEAATIANGSAYRVGGDEFCVLAEWPADQAPDALIERARAALCEQGDAFTIGASAGYAMLPGDAADVDEAMRVADRRLYAEKHSGRMSARLQSAGVLRSAMSEWDAELAGHTNEVADLAVQVARRLGLDEDEIERVAIAADLHDIGKIAIPRAILQKPGPLNAEEWDYMRRHTLIGERIVQSAPALVGVSGLIRSSHERWDGTGYPDQLAGDDIPLGSQIVLVCDAYAAMTSTRSYQSAMSLVAALAELRDNAGTQFAPTVVDAALAVWAELEAAAAPVA